MSDVNETGLPVEECDRAYDFYMKMFGVTHAE